MEFTNKLYLSFIFVFIQLLTVFSAPLSNDIPHPDLKWPAYFIKPNTWGNKAYAYVYSDKYELKAWPGIELQHVHYNQEPNFYTFEVPFELFFDAYIIFTDGENQAPAKMKEGFKFGMTNGVYTTEGCVGRIRQLEGEEPNDVVRYSKYACIKYVPKFENPDDFGVKDVYIHYKIGGREWTEAPGEKLRISACGINVFQYITCLVVYENEKDFSFVFTDGHGHWDNNNGKNYYYKTIDFPDERITIESDVIFN